jgi:hypothetical protein
MSVSEPSFISFEQVSGWQTPPTQPPVLQSPLLLQNFPGPQGTQVLPQSMSVS